MTHIFDSERVLRLLTADVRSTLGRELLPDVLDVAANVGALAVGLMEPEEGLMPHAEAGGGAYSVEQGQRYYDQKVVDDFQQFVQDMHIDTSWPTCPRHPHHPMDYREAIDAWCCPRDGAAIVRLGELAPRSR